MTLHKQGSILALAAALLLTGGCSGTGGVKQTATADIVTQTTLSGEKIPVTVLVKNAFLINTFEAAVEEKFPQLDLIQVGNYTRDMGINEYARRMEHDDLTDVVMTWPLDVANEYWSSRLIDLSSMAFTSKYNTSMLNSISQDGALYYLPGPAQVRGIVYNKTMFAEKGWEVPQDYDGFVALCQEIEESGMRSIQLGFGNSEVLSTAFTGYSFGDCYSTPANAQWLENYNKGNGSFGDQFGPALDTFQQMIDAGIWKESDLDVTYADREFMLFNRQCAMVEDSVILARMGDDRAGNADEFALMPFFSPNSDTDWARLYMVCYIGLNKHLTEPQNEAKYNLVLQMMDYISTPEGQAALSGDTGAMYSSVADVPPPNIPEIQDLLPALNHGRYAIFPTMKNAQTALQEGLAGMLRGNTTKAEVIAAVDKANLTPPSATTTLPLGTAQADFTLIETGNFITDTMRAQAGSDVALFLDNGKDGRYNSKGISGRIYQGSITMDDLLCVMPDLRMNERGVLQTVTMTGENLLKTLEYAIPVDNNITGWFYYFSGLRMEFDPTAAPGSRIKSITDLEGENIDPQREYTVAVMDETVPAAYMIELEDSNLTLLDLLTQTIRNSKTIAPSGDGRFTVVTAE